MSEDEEYIKEIYENSVKLKIVGIICPKEGVTTMALNPGVAYTSDLVDYIINYSILEVVKLSKESQAAFTEIVLVLTKPLETTLLTSHCCN